MERDESVFLKPPSWECEFCLEALSQDAAELPENADAIEVVRASRHLAVGRWVSWRDGQLVPHGEPFLLRRLSQQTPCALQFEGISWGVVGLGEENDQYQQEMAVATRLRAQLRLADLSRADDEWAASQWRARCSATISSPGLTWALVAPLVLVVFTGLLAWLFGFAR